MNSSLTSADRLWFDKMEKCNCPLKLEVMFVCLKKENECPDSKLQKYYCMECNNQGKHDHKSIMIVGELNKLNKRWLNLKALVSETF